MAFEFLNNLFPNLCDDKATKQELRATADRFNNLLQKADKTFGKDVEKRWTRSITGKPEKNFYYKTVDKPLDELSWQKAATSAGYAGFVLSEAKNKEPYKVYRALKNASRIAPWALVYQYDNDSAFSKTCSQKQDKAKEQLKEAKQQLDTAEHLLRGYQPHKK